MDSNFEELSNDTSIIYRMKQFSKATNDIEQMMDLISDPALYDSLTNADKIKYNMMMSFALNSLFWMYLRAEGVDPTNHSIRAENNRLKQAMARAQEIRDRNTIMPRVNKDAAKRFIRNSLWVPNNISEENNTEVSLEDEGNWDVEHPDQLPSTNNV
ncbi:hypothetical protein PV325_006395 [Microctonus aethiopoides]|uniref:Nuclear nucleic acid-binding protein C1D n=1 Tax=Microctonus aethiopoides TaxID=144406 RepID=A0AA39FZ41_9HYME|nr:hypothetical protein PV325_006395 [Microctonus aethiopoides]KAK0091465.1 hypothetical protein PV326_003203 [Microctonus aethiopoides]KAK0178348.1 hypothetical protein PV328_002305 [Microctonus aethiopoides]